MPTDLERLVVQLSADIKRYENALARARGITNKEFASIERRAATLTKKLDGIGSGFGRNLKGAFAGIGAALGTREVIAYADAWTVANNKLNAASEISGRQARALQDVVDIADATRSGITETTDLYSKLLRATRDVATSEEEVAKATTTVNQAFKAGGSATSEQIAGILQLSQALASGLLQGDELRSLREAAPLLAQAVADEFGTTIGGLKELGAQGELTASRIYKAILKAQPQIEAAFLATNRTIGDSFTMIENQFIKYIGQTDEANSASSRLVDGLTALADNFDAVADTAIAFASILAAGLLGRSIAKMIAQLGAGTAALYGLVKAFRAAQGAAGGGAGTVAVLGRLGSVAGPVGAAIGVASAAALYFATSSDEASESGSVFEKTLRQVETAAEAAAKEVENAGEKISERRKFELNVGLEKAQEQIKEVSQEAIDYLDDIIYRIETLPQPQTIVTQEQLAGLKSLRNDLASGSVDAEKLNDAFVKLVGNNEGLKSLAEGFHAIVDRLTNLLTTLGLINEQIVDINKIADMGDERGQVDNSAEEYRKFVEERDRVASSTEEEQKLAAKTKEVMEAAEKAGMAMTEAAAKIQAAGEIARENLTKAAEAQQTTTADLIKKFESFSAEAYPDYTYRNGQRVNSGYRVGFGSGEVTLSDGSVRQVVQGMTTTMEAANRDLARRIGEFQEGIVRQIGQARFSEMNENQVAALTSIAYNYGSLPQRIVEAIKTGNVETIGDAIRALGTDNKGVNQSRRNEEADIFESGAPVNIQADIQLRREHKQVIQETMTAIQQQNEQIGLETGLINASNAERERQMLIFETLNQLESQGVEITDELRAAVEAEAAARYGQVAAYDAAAEASERLKQKQEELQAIQDEIAGAFQDSLKGLITDLVHGKDATEALYNAVSKLADRLLDIALDMIFKNMFNNLAGSLLGGGGGILGGLFHGGGTVGGGVSGRNVSPLAFAGAQRYHTGGQAGLMPGEVPIIAQRGEVILPRSQVRQLTSGNNKPVQNVDARTTVINRFDAAGVLSEALSQPEGVKVVLNVIRSQPGAFRQAING